MTRTPDLDHLRALFAVVQLGLRAEIVNRLNSQPRAQHFDGDRTTGGGGSDPTANAATSRDRARHDLEVHDQAVDRAYRALLALAALSDHYLPTHEPRRNDVLRDTKGCVWHEQAGVEEHRPVAHRTDFGTILESPLPEPVDVCQVCYDFVRSYKVGAKPTAARPTNEELHRHERTGTWTQRTAGKRASVFSARDIADEWESRTA